MTLATIALEFGSSDAFVGNGVFQGLEAANGVVPMPGNETAPDGNDVEPVAAALVVVGVVVPAAPEGFSVLELPEVVVEVGVGAGVVALADGVDETGVVVLDPAAGVTVGPAAGVTVGPAADVGAVAVVPADEEVTGVTGSVETGPCAFLPWVRATRRWWRA